MLRMVILSIASIILTAVPHTVEAACSLLGKWHLSFIGGTEAGELISNCTLEFDAAGRYTATCQSYSTFGSPLNATGNGKFVLAPNCTLTGTLKSPGLANSTIRGGRIDDRVGYFTATRGPGPQYQMVRMFMMSKM
jgi:hypothetical protein